MQYYLQLGNTPSLSFNEAKAIIGDSVVQIDDRLCSFTAETDQEAKDYFRKLGASVRLVSIQKDFKIKSQDDLIEKVVEHFVEEDKARMKISCAQWGDMQTARIDFFALKKALLKEKIKVRFVEGPRHGLSAAVLLHQNVQEVIIIQNGNDITLGKTIDVQDIDHWTVKDRRKPYANRKKGMLPPKIALAMLNLARGNSEEKGLVYDPFCGTGTVLIEALEQGFDVIGSDLDPEAILGSQMNLAWFKDREKLDGSFTVFKADVTQVTKERISQKVDYIVTEPFLGRPKPNASQLPGVFRGLEKLYTGAFKNWQSLLHDGSKVAIVFPRVESGNKVFDLSGLIDKLSSQGYTLLVNFGDIRYARKSAIVQRDILVFEYNK
ncbi:MAG: hypothetical protein HN981_04915 [Candidatus Pacebacteria bacterium]|jgi:tRNA G10  N-methylase Trm11|nr:hypothetical protein [Candidatus Paceibacterota bacterium]MBT4652090.1 hypothetical protein [Candidatus Paceibacterota bacterium]MBT6756112.1 hypothetical protein [Candidatus Paceibacterota bacterium]MBT6921705.1 hypothetical protein [Candidatus Paceibacterota bacterium]